jgi:all-trans-8'-apo-beta-carotenal 15,15'-oxygenase
MDRRLALQTLAALAATPAAARAAPASRVTRFDAAAARQPWLLPLKGVTDASGALDAARLQLSGRWPDDLRGRFYRNGPALFERSGARYHHWFDGDGMVQQFTLGGGAGAPVISHRGRLVATSKLRREQRAGRFLMSAFGTGIAPPADAPVQGPDSFNTANTNAIEHAGRVLAMWEGGSAHALDPADLSTHGPVTWGEGLEQLPFSAHPKVDRRGHLWNIGAAGKHLVVWHIDPQGQLASARRTDLPLPQAMVHDMAVTRQHVVVPIAPLTLHLAELERGAALEQAIRFHPEQPLRVLVMRKDDLTQRRVFELPPQMVFHVGNAFERNDGEIELSYVGATDAGFLTVTATAMMVGDWLVDGRFSTQRAVLDLRSGRARLEAFDDQVEFPRMDPRRIGLPARWLVQTASWRHDRPNGMFHGLQLCDLQRGGQRRYDYGDRMVVEEHVVVPKPGREGELDAWLLGTTFDTVRKVTVLNVLDAAYIEDGPLAQAALPYTLPYGFHGNFTAA